MPQTSALPLSYIHHIKLGWRGSNPRLMINSHLLDPPATSQYPSYSFHIRRFFQRVFFSKILINTCLVTFVRLSVWQFIYVSAISTGNRAVYGNQTRACLRSGSPICAFNYTNTAKFSVFITVKPNCKNFFHLRWSNSLNFFRDYWRYVEPQISFDVGLVGLNPTRMFQRQILSLFCLSVPA